MKISDQLHLWLFLIAVLLGQTVPIAPAIAEREEISPRINQLGVSCQQIYRAGPRAYKISPTPNHRVGSLLGQNIKTPS